MKLTDVQKVNIKAEQDINAVKLKDGTYVYCRKLPSPAYNLKVIQRGVAGAETVYTPPFDENGPLENIFEGTLNNRVWNPGYIETSNINYTTPIYYLDDVTWKFVLNKNGNFNWADGAEGTTYRLTYNRTIPDITLYIIEAAKAPTISFSTGWNISKDRMWISMKLHNPNVLPLTIRDIYAVDKNGKSINFSNRISNNKISANGDLTLNNLITSSNQIGDMSTSKIRATLATDAGTLVTGEWAAPSAELPIPSVSVAHYADSRGVLGIEVRYSVNKTYSIPPGSTETSTDVPISFTSATSSGIYDTYSNKNATTPGIGLNPNNKYRTFTIINRPNNSGYITYTTELKLIGVVSHPLLPNKSATSDFIRVFEDPTVTFYITPSQNEWYYKLINVMPVRINVDIDQDFSDSNSVAAGGIWTSPTYNLKINDLQTSGTEYVFWDYENTSQGHYKNHVTESWDETAKPPEETTTTTTT